MFSLFVRARYTFLAILLLATLCERALGQQNPQAGLNTAFPRTREGKPDLQGIWQVRTRAAYDLEDHPAKNGIPPGRGVVEGGKIPYQPWAAAKRQENFANRQMADPVGKCYLPGVPRIMYMEFPFQIFQTSEHVAILFEWSLVYRLIYTNGKPAQHPGIESWMGDSRGRWEGDVLVVSVTDHNDKTWFDMAGNFHSDALRVTERYAMQDANTIQYEVTIEDPKVFTRPWKIRMPLFRHKDMDRVLEYQCQAEVEEAAGLFERDPRTWYPPSESQPIQSTTAMPVGASLATVKPGANLPRTPNGKPDLSGYIQPDHGDANYAIEHHPRTGQFLQPGTKGVVIDPPDGLLPYKPWAREEHNDRQLPHRGYDDPYAHCFEYGVPRTTMYPFELIQTPEYVVMLFERMSWRLIPLDGRAHIPDNIRLWQGDSVGHWEGDILVVETTNLNGRSWPNETDVFSYTQHVVERFIPVDAKKTMYRVTVTDPIVYTRPWTIEYSLNRQTEEILEVACHEDNGDLQHLKDVKDEYRAQQKKRN